MEQYAINFYSTKKIDPLGSINWFLINVDYSLAPMGSPSEWLPESERWEDSWSVKFYYLPIMNI